MPKKTDEQLGLTQDKDGNYQFRIQKGSTWLDRMQPYLIKIDESLYSVQDTSFKTLNMLKDATKILNQIMIYRQNYEKAVIAWDKIVTETGADGILPPPNVEHMALTLSERKAGLKGLEGYERWEDRKKAWDELQKCIVEMRNGNRMLEPCQIYFQFKKENG